MEKRFRFFSLIFSYPSEKILEELESLSREIPEYSKIVEMLKTHTLEELQTEYTRLFITDHPTLTCPPYESYYREGSVYGNASVEVREIYESHGLEYNFEGEPPDHISVELEFIALTGDREFLNRMKEWVFYFADKVKESSEIYGLSAEELKRLIEDTLSFCEHSE